MEFPNFFITFNDPWWMCGLKVAWWFCLGSVAQSIVSRLRHRYKAYRKNRNRNRNLDAITKMSRSVENITTEQGDEARLFEIDTTSCRRFIEVLKTDPAVHNPEQLLTLIRSVDAGIIIPCDQTLFIELPIPMSRTRYGDYGREVFGKDFTRNEMQYTMVTQVIAILLCEELGICNDQTIISHTE